MVAAARAGRVPDSRGDGANVRVPDIAIRSAGLVTSVGLTAPASCAAFRAKVTNPTETRFIDVGGEWLMAHQVQLALPWRGITKLAKMAALAIEEALQDVPRSKRVTLPLLLCVAELERPGRLVGIEDQLFPWIQNELETRFASESAIVAEGRVGVAVALAQARELIAQGRADQVLVAATDSLLSWQTLSYYQDRDRLLTARNSNGFLAGEAAGALLVCKADGKGDQLVCTGIGLGHENSHIDSDEPLRADGLTLAIKAALAEASLQMHDMDFRITDISGEQYYFKEASLALSRTLRVRKEEFDIWHPAECVGEVGSTSGVVGVAAAQAACAKRYSKGWNILAHMAADSGKRAALSLQYRAAP